jgi:hypothetical protein
MMLRSWTVPNFELNKEEVSEWIVTYVRFVAMSMTRKLVTLTMEFPPGPALKTFLTTGFARFAGRPRLTLKRNKPAVERESV